jgi:hypothetical protein
MIQDIDANMCQEVVCALFRSCFRIELPGLNAKCSAYTVRLPSFEPKPRDFFFHNYCKTFFFGMPRTIGLGYAGFIHLFSASVRVCLPQ